MAKKYTNSSQTSNSSPSRERRQPLSTFHNRVSTVHQRSDARAAAIRSYESYIAQTGSVSTYPSTPTTISYAGRLPPSAANHRSELAKESPKATAKNDPQLSKDDSSAKAVAQDSKQALNAHIAEDPVPSHTPLHTARVTVQPALRSLTSHFPRRTAFPTIRDSSAPYVLTAPTTASASVPERRRLRERHAKPQWVSPQSTARRTAMDIPAREVNQEELEALTVASVAPVLFEKRFLRQPREDQVEAAMRLNTRHLLGRQPGKNPQSLEQQTRMGSSSRTGRTMAVPTMTRSLRRDLIIENIFGTGEEGLTSASEA